ncbi:MAG: NAD-dependent epimerase/dehydratase family protein [Patescibacteria group bacterium]
MKKTKVIVTGGAGFIGSHLVKRLVMLGSLVTVVDNLSRGSLKNIKEVKDKVRFIKKDLREERGLEKIFEGHHLVFNLAALNTGIDYEQGRIQEMFENNMLLQMMPLRVASRVTGISKFIQVSSAVVYSRYAMERKVPTPEDADTCNPEPSKLGYALAKKMGENLAKWYSAKSRLKTVIVRLVNTYGETDNFDEKGHFIPVIIRKFLTAEKEVVVFGSGNQKRSFLYVSDAVDALMLLARSGENGAVYNVDAGEEHSIKEVVDLIQKKLGNRDLRIKFDRSKPEGSKRRLLDSTKIRRLGWSPSTSLEVGLDRIIEDIARRILQK